MTLIDVEFDGMFVDEKKCIRSANMMMGSIRKKITKYHSVNGIDKWIRLRTKFMQLHGMRFLNVYNGRDHVSILRTYEESINVVSIIDSNNKLLLDRSYITDCLCVCCDKLWIYESGIVSVIDIFDTNNIISIRYKSPVYLINYTGIYVIVVSRHDINIYNGISRCKLLCIEIDSTRRCMISCYYRCIIVNDDKRYLIEW